MSFRSARYILEVFIESHLHIRIFVIINILFGLLAFQLAEFTEMLTYFDRLKF